MLHIHVTSGGVSATNEEDEVKIDEAKNDFKTVLEAQQLANKAWVEYITDPKCKSADELQQLDEMVSTTIQDFIDTWFSARGL